MADLSIAVADVLENTDRGANVVSECWADVAINRGQSVYTYNDNTNSRLGAGLFDALGSWVSSRLGGIALQDVSAGQRLQIITKGAIHIGGTLSNGQVILGSGNNEGGLAPQGDFATNWYYQVAGFHTGDWLYIAINNTNFIHGRTLAGPAGTGRIIVDGDTTDPVVGDFTGVITPKDFIYRVDIPASPSTLTNSDTINILMPTGLEEGDKVEVTINDDSSLTGLTVDFGTGIQDSGGSPKPDVILSGGPLETSWNFTVNAGGTTMKE